MANGRDTLRLVTLSTGGRPVEVLDLNDANQYWRDRDAGFTYTPPPATQQVARTGRRYGGGRVVGESHDNATVAWTAYVRGTTVTSAAQRVEQLLDEINDAARGRYVEWAPDGLSSSFMEIAGPGTWLAVYDPLQLSQAFGMRVQITFPVLPLVRWAPMTIGDDFSVNSLSDYTFDSLASSDVSVSSGNLYAAGGSLTSERRVRHTARGYDLLEGRRLSRARPPRLSPATRSASSYAPATPRTTSRSTSTTTAPTADCGLMSSRRARGRTGHRRTSRRG
jgi:hypothetical protein